MLAVNRFLKRVVPRKLLGLVQTPFPVSTERYIFRHRALSKEKKSTNAGTVDQHLSIMSGPLGYIVRTTVYIYIHTRLRAHWDKFFYEWARTNEQAEYNL